MTKESKEMSPLWRKSSKKNLQVRREARRMAKARSSALTVEGASIQKAPVWEDNLMKWLFFWKSTTFLYLLAQGRKTLKKKKKNTKGKDMHWKLAAHQHLPSSLILELPTHMAASRESFSSFQSFDGPSIQMGNSSKVQTKGKGSIQLEHGRFKDVLFVPSLASNLLSVY